MSKYKIVKPWAKHLKVGQVVQDHQFGEAELDKLIEDGAVEEVDGDNNSKNESPVEYKVLEDFSDFKKDDIISCDDWTEKAIEKAIAGGRIEAVEK